MKAAGGDASALAKIETLYAKKSANARMAATGQVISRPEGPLQGALDRLQGHDRDREGLCDLPGGAERARDRPRHRAHGLVGRQLAARTTANTAEGGSKIFAQLGVWAFPVVAAMVAVLAALGAKGGGGGSSGPSIPSADDIQAGNGAGTVLGDSAAKSESIQNALELVAANTNKDLEYSNAMLKRLRSIDFSISKLAGTVARRSASRAPVRHVRAEARHQQQEAASSG
jgi:hypothetical protein